MNVLSPFSIQSPGELWQIHRFQNENLRLPYAFSPDTVLLYCESGTLTVSLLAKALLLKSDDCILIPPHVLHRITADDFCGTALVFKNAYLQKHFSEPFAARLLAAFPGDTVYIENCKKNAPFASRCGSEDFGFIDLARLLLVLEKEAARWDGRSTVTPFSGTLQKIVEHITEKPEGDLSVSGVARMFSLSDAHVCRLCKKEMALTPTELITACRMSRAARLLTETELSVRQISGMCGLSSHTHFQTLFKKCIGVTPKEYRLMQT